ncbi:leucine-rich repeat transmembrane protein CCDC168 [Peromyscus maniculatus bairdii]|uniref:leucine-rich repeat transmembrane protein CCDC168 n=1 Tax=Peromyscus maniculatus bairdii TaxID=230844 RepID=UPI001C2E50AB|nr:coiled-coil domain-containing protein 168 [Peromyscus maniculatus bairdii]
MDRAAFRIWGASKINAFCMRYQAIMSKIYHFFKKKLKSILDENTFCTIWDFLDSWIFNNAWIPILFLIFLGVAFEIILVRTCEFFKKKLELWENESSCAQKNEDVFPKGMTFAIESWSISQTSSAERVETFSGRITTSSPSAENGDNTSERTFSPYECEYQGSHFCESHSSSGGTSTSLSMFYSEVNKIFMRSFHRKDPQSEYQTIQFSSNKLLPIMKTNRTKNKFPDALSFQSTFKFTRDKDLNVTPCPPVHLFLSSDQIRHVEENVRRKIPVNPKAISVREDDCLHPSYQEPLIHYQHSKEVVIPAEAQDTLSDQSAMQNQMIHEAQFTNQTQPFIYNQESVSSQPDFVQPLYFMRLPFSNSLQDSFQAQQIDHKDKSQHFIHIPCIVEDSTKGIESDEHFSETQYSVYLNDQNKSNHLVKGKNSVFQNAEFLSLSSNSFVEPMPQQKIIPGQEPVASLESNQFYAYSIISLSPTIKRQKNRRKIPDNERKLSLKFPSPKAKKISRSRVFPIIVCHTSENKTELRCKKKKIAHQRKVMSDRALHLISVSKLINLQVKKYFFKNLVAVIPDFKKCEHFLKGQNKSLDTEKINYASSTDRVSLGIIKNIEHVFIVNTHEMKAPCSLFETDRESKESNEDSVQQTFDLNIPKHEGLSEVSSDSAQKDVSFPHIESNKGMKVQKGIQSTENVEKLTVSTPNVQRCFLKDGVQNAENSVEITLNFLGTNLLISLGPEKHVKNELKDMNVQVITGSKNLKEEKPLTVNITEYGNPNDSEKMECVTRSNKKNRHHDERMSDTSHNTMQAAISEPFDMEICNKLKANAGTPTINCSHTALKQEKLLDEKKIQEVKHADKSPMVRKPPREWDCEEEEKRRETVRLLAEVSVYLKQKDKCAQFEMEQIHLGNRKNQSKEKEVQSQTISTQTIWETSPRPLTNPLQVEEVKQRTDKPIDREEAAGPMHSPLMPENLPVGECLTETTECRGPLCGNPTKTLDGHIIEDKEDLKKDQCSVATGPLKVRKKSSGPKNVRGVKHKIIKVKKTKFSLRLSITARDILHHRRKVENSFENITKQMLYDVTLGPGLLNVHPQRFIIHNNKTNIKKTPQKTQIEKKENLDPLNKESEAVNTLEVHLRSGVKAVGQVLPETVTHVKKSFRFDARPVKEIKMEKEMFQAISFTEAIRKSADSPRMDSFCVANTKNSTSTQTELQYCTELELGPPTSGKLWMGESLSQSRESNVPNSGNDCGFTQKAFSWSLNNCMPLLTHSKKKKERTRLTNTSTVRLKYTNKVKPPVSKTFNITGNKKKSKLDLKTKLKRTNQKKALLHECQNTLCLSIHRRLKGVFCHALLKQRGLPNKICVDCVVESSAFYKRKKKLQEEKQNPFIQAAPQHGKHQWADADQRKDTLQDEPDPSPISLSQEQLANSQSIKFQKDSLQSALETNPQMAPIQAKGLQKATKTENDINLPVVPKILSPESGNSSPGEFTNMTDDDLESDNNSEHELDLYPAEKDSETSSLQVTFLQSSDSVTRSFVSRPKGKRKALRSKKQITVSQKCRAMREIKPSVSQTGNFRYSKKLKRHKEMKDPQQTDNIAGACLDIVHYKVYILPNKKIISSKPWADKQRRIRRLGRMQRMQEKSPNGRNARCLGSADLNSSSSMKKYEEEGEEELEHFLISENSPSLIFDMYQEKDHGLVRSDKQLNQLGRTITQVQPQTPTEVISCSTLCSIPDELQLEKLEGCFSVSPLKFREVKDNALSERESDLSDGRRYKEQAADSEKEAKELLASYTNPNLIREIKCDSTKMKGMYQEKKIADETSSLTNVALDINMSSKIETRKGTPSKKTPCSIQRKPKILLHEARVTSDDIKEIDLQDKEEKKNDNDTLLKSFPQYSQHFVICSHQSRDPNSHKLRKQRGRNNLFIVEQDIPQQSQSADLTRREHAMCTSSSKIPPIQSGELQIDKVKTDRTKYDIPNNGTLAQKLNSWNRLEREGLQNDLQATITESLNLSTPDVPRSKRKSKVSTCKALQGKMCSTGITMKGRKTSVSKLLTIPQCGHRNNLLPKTLKSQIFELLIHSGVLPDSLNIIILKDPTAEGKKGLLTQELATTMLESLGFSIPTSKERENLKLMDKVNEMSKNSLTVKTRKEAISQTLITAECRTPKQGIPMAGSSLHAIFSPMPVSLNTCDGIKDRDTMWTMRFSHEFHDQSVHKEGAWCTHYLDKDTTSNGTKDVKGQSGEEHSLTSQHFSFSAQNMTGPNSVKSGLQLINSATYPELERTLYYGQAQTVNVNNLQSSMVGVMSTFLNTEESEIGSIPCDNTWDENTRRKCDYPIFEQKAWTQKDLTSLEPLQEPSLVSFEYKCESCTLEFAGKRDMNPKARQASRLLNIARHFTRVHRKKRHHNSKHWLRKVECVEEVLLYAIEDAKSCPLKFITDKLSLDTAARIPNRIPQRSMAEEKAKLQANLATTFLGPYNFLRPLLSDFKSQVNTAKLSENEILLNKRFSTMKKMKLSISKIIKINGYSITNHKKKSKLRAKMKAMWIGEIINDVLQNTIHFILTNSNRKDPFKTEVGLGVSNFTHTQPTHGKSPVEGTTKYDDSVDKSGSNFSKKAKLYVGQCLEEKQELLIESGPFYTKNLAVNAHLIKKPSLEESERILLREYLPQRSQIYEANPEINVKIENNSMHVSLKDALSNMDKPHNCPEASEPSSNTTKHGVKKTGKSFLKEKSSFYLTGIITSIARHLVSSKEFKKQIGNMRVPDLPAHKGMESTDLQSPHDGDHAAVNINETQDLRTLEIKVDNGEINIDTKSIYMCTPIQHIKTESSHSIWDMYEESAKRNCLDKPELKRKEECGQLPFGADQKRQPDPLTSEVLSTNTVNCKDSTLQKTAIYQEGNAKVGEEFGQEVILSSKTHTLQIERQNNEFKTGWKTKSKFFALQKKQEKPSILGPTWSSYACDTTYPETIRQKGKAKKPNVKSSVCAKQTKLKAKKIPVPLLLGHGGRSNKKELGRSMQHQSTLELRRNVQNLILKGNFDLGCFISPVKKLTSIKLEKGKLEERKNVLPQIILEKPSSQRQMSWSGCIDVSRKLEENIKEVHDHCTFKDIHQQFIQQFRVTSEEIKEHHSYKLENLQRKMNSELTSQKDETDNFGLATLRSRGGTKVYTDPHDSLQQEYPLKQGMWKPGMILQPMKGFPHFGMTNEFITKQDIKPSSPQRIGGLKVIDNPLDSKESLLVPRITVQKQNPFTDPLLESIPSHVPHQLHTEELKENMKISGKTLKTSTQQPKKVSNAEYISDMDHIPRNIEKLLLLIKEQEKRRKKSRGSKKIEIVEDIKTATKNTIPFLNYSPPGTQFVNTIKNSGVFRQREETEPTRSVATLWRQQRLCVQGIGLDYVYTDELTSKVICQNRRTAFMERIMYHKRIKMKARKTTSGKQLNITGYRAHSYRKELRHSIKTQKELSQGKTVADLLWKGLCASDNSSISSTIRKSTQYTIKQKEHQVVLLAITPQNKDQLMTGQQVEEPRLINFNAHLEKEAYHVMFPETGETNYSKLEAQRPRSDTEFEFSTAQRVKQGVMKDSSKHALLVPPRRGGPKRINILSSRGHDISLMELDTFQKKTGNVQELLKQENTSRVGLESVACTVRESFHLENTKVTKEVGMYHNIKNISHLFGLRKTDTELGFKAQAFLCTDLEDLHKTGTAQKGHAKSGHRPRISLNSVPCHKRAPLHLKPSLSTARKDHGDSAIVAKMNPKGKEKAKSADSPLKLNRQKVNISKNLRAKQLIIFTQTKEKVLEILLSCILYLQAKNTQKQISAKASLNSNIFNPMVEKGSSEFKILEDQSPSSERVYLHTKGGTDHQESMCEALPMSNTHCLMNIHRITTPQIKKALKSLANLDYHALNTEKGEQNNMIKEQNQYHLSFSLENLEEHISFSQNYSHVQQYLEFHTKEELSKVGNVSNRTKGLDLSSKDQRSTVCECRPEWIFPSVILEQTKEEDTVLPLESGTIKCSSFLSSERKQLSDGVQISKSVSNDSSTTPRCSKRELSDRASEKKQEVSLPKLFLHCFSLCMQFLHEHEKQKSNTEYRVLKDIIFPERKALNLKTLVLPHISSTEYTTSNKVELQFYKKEKMVCIKHGEDKPGSVVIKACEPIPLPHFKLDKENIDELISSNVRQEKHKSQEEKNGIKGVEMKGIIDSNITLKTENSSLSYPSSRKKLTLPFDTTEQQGKVQEGLSKSDMKLTKSFISLPPILHPNLNSKIKVGKDKSRLLESCLPPLKPLLSLKGRKVPFSKTFSTDNLCKLIESKYLPQKKEYRNSIPDLKDIIGLICIAQKRKKSPFKCLLRRKEQWWNNKTRKIIQGNKNNLNVVQNKPWDSVPSSPYLKWDPEIMEAYLQGIMKFCLGSPALSELSSTVGQYQESTDGISSSTEKAKHIPLKHRLQIAPKEGRHFRGPVLRQELFSASQELQFNVEKKATKMQEDKQIKNWNKPSKYSLPYSEVVPRINGEETMQIRTRFSIHHPKLQRPSDIEEIIYAKSNFEPSLNSVKHATKYAFQKEAESTKTKKTMQLKEKPSVSQTIQLVITEPGQEIQKIKDELNVVETSTSTWIPSPCLKSDTRIEKADSITEATLHSLPELPLQKSSATLSEVSKEWAKGHSTTDTQRGEDHMPQKTEHKVKILGEKVTMHTKDKDCKGNKIFSQDLLSSPKEQGKIDPQNEEQERVDGKDKKQQNCNNDGKDQKKMDLNYKKTGKCSQDDKEQKKMDLEGKEQGEAGGDGQEQEEDCPEDGEQETWNHKCDTQGKMNPNSIEPRKAGQEGKSKEKVAPEYLPSKSSHKLDIGTAGEENMQGTIKSANSQLQHQKLLETGKTEYTESTEDDGKSNIKIGKQCESQTWMDRGKNVHTKDVMHSKDKSSNKNQLPLSHIPSITGHYGPNTTDEETNVNENLGHVQERKCKLGTSASLPHSKLDIEIKAKEETWIETRSFSLHLQSMESSDAEKLNYIASSLNDISDSKRSRYMSYKEENGVNTFERSMMHSKTKHVNINKSPLSYVPKIKRLKVNLEKQIKNKQESRKEKVMLPSETHSVITSSDASKLDQAEEVETDLMQSHVPYPMPQESLPVRQVASTKAIARKRKLHLPWEEEEVQTSAIDDLTHPNDSIFKTEKTAPYLVSSVNEHSTLSKKKTRKWSSNKKTGQKQERARHPNVIVTKSGTSVSSPVGQVAPAKQIAECAKKRKQYQAQEEVKTSAIDGLTQSSGLVLKVSAPPHVLSVSENSIPRKRKTPWRSSKEKIGQKQEKTRESNVFATKNDTSVPHHGLSPLQDEFLMTSCTGELARVGSNEGITLPNVIIKANQQELYTEAKVSIRDKDTKDTITLRARISPPAHLNDRTPPVNSKEQRKEAEQSKSELMMVVPKGTAYLPSPSFLKSDTRVSEEEDVLGETQISFLPPKIQDVSDSEKIACMESTGYVLNNKKEPTQEEKKKRPRKDVTDKKIPKSVDKKGKKLPRSHTLSIKEFQRKIQEEKLVNTIVKFSISQLQLEKFSGAQMADREVYNEIKLLKEHVPGKEKHMGVNSVMHAKDIYLKTKKSPALPMQNLSDLQWKTREQGGKVEEDGSKPGVTLTKKLSKTSTAMSHEPILTPNTGIKEECTSMLTRSSVSMGYLQKSSDSEGGIYIQQITGDIAISLQNEKQHMSEGKEEAGMQIAKIVTTHNYQETKVQGLEDEQGLVLTKSFPLLPDLPHPKLHEKIEFNDTKLRNSTLQRLPAKGETVPREAIVGDTMKDVKKEHRPQREETYRKEIIDRRGTDITLKSQKSLLSQKLHRTELQMHINTSKSKGQNNESEPRVLRKIYTSKPSPTVILCKGVKVDEEHLESKLSSPLQQMFPALSDTEEMADKEAMCDHVRKEKQYTKQIEKTVDLTTGVHCKRTKVLPISHLLNTKEFVLNMKVLEKKVHKGKSELAVVATRSFLSMPSLPCRYSQDKTQKGTGRVTAHSYPQGNFQEPEDAQETATRKSAEATEHNMLQKQARPQKSVTSAHRIGEHPQVESECESVSPDHKIDLTRLGTIKREKMLDMFFKGQKGQPEKCEKESSTEIGNWKKENEIKDNLRHKTSSKFPVSPLKKSLREVLIKNNTLLAKGSETEREQETGSGKSDKPKRDKQSNATISNILTPEKTSLEKPRIAHLNKSQNREDQNVNMKEQTTPQSKSGHQIKPKSFPLLNVPVHSKSQRMPSQTDVDEKTAVTVSPQIQLGVHMSTAEFNATRSKDDPPSIVLEQEQYDLALPQKSHDSLLKSEHLEDRDEMNIISDVNLKQKNLEIDSNCTVSQREGKLKTDRSRGIDLEEVNREMQKSCSVNLENKARENTSSTTNYALPLGTEESEIKTGLVTPRENNYPSQKKLKKELELSTAKQNLQGLKLLQTNIFDSLYPSIPICPKSQNSRFTVTNLKRELKPKYLTLRIPKHPISKILGIIGCGSPSSRRKLEYAFNKPKTMIPSSKDVSGIIIRSLCVSMVSPPHTEGTVESTTNPRREKRVCHTKFQEKLPDARDIKDILTIVKGLNFTIPLLQDSQPFVVSDQETWKLPDMEPEVNLECEMEKNLCLQTREEVVAGSEDLNITHKPDMNTTEQEEIQKDTITPQECPFEDIKDTIETHLRRTLSIKFPPPGIHPIPGTPLFDKMRECFLLSKQGEAAPGTVPTALQDKNNKNKTLVERLFPVYETLKSIFEAPLENKIQNQILPDKLGEVGAYKPDDAKASPLPDSPDTSSKVSTILLRRPLLKQFTPELKNKLSMHLVSKATEIKLNQLPEMVNISLQKCNSHPQRATSEDYKCRLYLKHKKMNFRSPKAGTIKANLKNNYRRVFPPLSCVKAPTMNVSSSSKVMTEAKGIKKQESVTSLETQSNLPLSNILHKFSEKENDDLLVHFCTKTLEIQTMGLPRIVVQSYAMANAQDKSKRLFKCIHSTTNRPQQTNRVLVLFDKKSFCEIDRDLQYKYLYSIPRPSVPVVSKPKVLSKHTSKLSMGLGSVCKTVEDSEKSNTLSFDKDLLQHISFRKKNPQESSLLTRKFQEPTKVPAFYPGLQGTKQNDMIVLSDLKLQMTPEKDNQCHVWFQESNSYKHSVSGTQQNTVDLADSHSSLISDGWNNDVPLNTETSTDLAEYPAHEETDSEECVFIETNFYLTQDSQKFLFEVPKGIPLADVHKAEEATFLKPFYHKDPNDHHTITLRKHTSPVAQPFHQSRNSRKHRSDSKMQSPDWLSHDLSNTVEIESTSSSITFNKEKHWTTTTWSRTSYSLTSSTTESNIKLNLAKKHSKSYMYPQVKERRKTKSYLWRKSNIDQSSNYSHSHNEEKHLRKKRLYHYKSKESNPQANQMTESNAHWQNIKFYSERRENQPFFYACIPADSMEVIPQTIRWVIPQKILQKRNFQVPRVANISKSWNLCSSSKKLLGSLAGAFNTVHYG